MGKKTETQIHPTVGIDTATKLAGLRMEYVLQQGRIIQYAVDTLDVTLKKFPDIPIHLMDKFIKEAVLSDNEDAPPKMQIALKGLSQFIDLVHNGSISKKELPDELLKPLERIFQ